MARSTQPDNWTSVIRLARIAGIILAVAFVISMFYPKYQEYVELERRQAALENEFRLEMEKLQALKYKQDMLRADRDFAERVAREEFGYARPGEKVIKFIDDESQTAASSAP